MNLRSRHTKGFILLVVVSLIVLTIFVILLSLFSLFSRTKSFREDVEKFTYRFVRYSNNEKKYSRGFVKIGERLLGDDFASYKNVDSFTLISNFETTEFHCEGTCFCDEEYIEERRTTAAQTPRLLTYLVAALSTTIATRIATSRFDEICSDEMSENCARSSIVSEVNQCESIEEKEKSSSTEEYSSYICTGHCIDRFFYGKTYPPESLTLADSYEVENPDEEIFPIEQSEWSDWMRDNHKQKSTVWVCLYKVHTKKKTLSFEELIDVAVRYGWVDGGVRRIDDEKYMIRFSRRRKKGSPWAQINLKKVRRFEREGTMEPEGMEAYQKWIDEHPEDLKSHCKKIDFSKGLNVELKSRSLKRWLKSNDEVEYAKKQFMKDMHRFCLDLSNTGNYRGGNEKILRCVGHERFENPSVKCVRE